MMNDNIGSKKYIQDMISVIIPSYNRESTIEACLRSVLAQSFTYIEVIVVDDCSTDNTVKIVRSIGDERLKCYHLSQNRGACFARNYGADIAKGEYIALQDSDDIWYKDKLKKQYDFLRSTNSDFVFCSMKRKNSSGNYICYPDKKKINEWDMYSTLLRQNCVSTVTMFMKHSVIDEVKFDISFRKYQDWDFAIRVSKKFRMHFLNEILVDSVVQQDSISKVINSYDAILHLYNKYEDEILKQPSINAEYMKKFGDALREKDILRAKEYYKNSLKIKFSFDIFVRYSLCKLGIMNFVTNIYRKFHF